MAGTEQHPLYGSTYTLYRLSPLYHGQMPLLTGTVLKTHARRLRDLLKGDTLRGVHVGTIESNLNNSGILGDCTWNLLGDENSWAATHRQSSDEEDIQGPSIASKVTADDARGIHIQLQYEKITHTALLLRDPAAEFTTSGFTSLPLLLVRMPATLRDTFLHYLTTNFDTRVSPMRLESSFLTASLQRLLARADSAVIVAPQDLSSLVKSIQIQLSFPSVAPLLKNIDIAIASEDVLDFVLRGKRLNERQPSAPSKHGPVNGPFMRALQAYLAKHLALTINHPGVDVSKVACGAFALSGDGKIKLFPPQPLPSSSSEDGVTDDSLSTSQLVMGDFYSALLREAERRFSAATDVEAGKSGKRAVDLTDEVATSKAKRQREQSLVDEVPLRPSVPADPPPPYELHDPARRQG